MSEDENVRQLVQVSWRMNEDSQTGRKTRKREIDGLVAAAEALNCEIIGYNGAVGGHAEYYNRGGTLEVNGYIVVGAFNSSNPGYAYMEVDGGLVTNKANEIVIGDSGTASTNILVVKSGTIASCGTFYIGKNAPGQVTVKWRHSVRRRQSDSIQLQGHVDDQRRNGKGRT